MATGKILKYSTHGVTSGLALHYIANGNNTVNIFGYPMDVRIAGFGLGFTSSALVDLIHQYIDPAIGIKGSFNDIQSQLIALSLSAGSFYALTMLSNKQLAAFSPAYLLTSAAVSEMAAQYLYNNFVNPMVLGTPSNAY